MNVAVHPERSLVGLTPSGPGSDQSAGGDRSGFTYISLCTGGGGLDLGLELAIPAARPVCLVEREAFAAAHLVAAMQAGLMADAPVWSDARTFDGLPWRGLVDGLIGGIPCQPHSMAGKRGGSTDTRDLWSDARRIIAQARPWFVLIENVAGMLTAGADEIAGAQRVRRDLRKLGYAVEGGLFTAAETGAPHERKRLFILGIWAGMADGNDAGLERHRSTRKRAGERPVGPGSGELGQPISCGHDGHDRRRAGSQPADGCKPLGDTQNNDGWGELEARSARRGRSGPAGTDQDMGDATGARGRCLSGGPEDGPEDRDTGWAGAASGCSAGTERPGQGQVPLFPPGPGERDRWASVASIGDRLVPALSRYDLFIDALRKESAFPHGSASSEEARDIVAQAIRALGAPRVHQIAESTLRGMADGLANRVDQLRMLGNGVMPLEAAYAIRSLLAAHRAAGTHQANELVLMEAANQAVVACDRANWPKEKDA